MNVRRAQLRDAAAIAHVQIDAWRSTYRCIVPDKHLDGMSYDRSQRNWEECITDPDKRNALFVAKDDGGTVVGFAACGAARDDARDYGSELYTIYVNQSMQRKGLGKRLVLSVAQDLKARGFDSMMVWVLADNRYRRFYESIGGRQIRTREVAVGGKTLPESGYGWRGMDALITRLVLE
ncbi:MAG: N-acetyltransferase family protein [Nitrososphaerales archaeon]